VRRGEFREDLYYRLSTVEISLPALRERKEDLPMLFRHFVKQSANEYGKSIGGISRRAQGVLTRYSWPGNVRELQNVISAACMMCERGFVDTDDLPERVKAKEDGLFESGERQWETLKAMQIRYASRVLEAMDGNKLQAAKALGVSRATLYRMLEPDCQEEDGPEASDGFLTDTSDDAIARSCERSIGLVR
jgi:transcriptional regulator with PAS, ATPase and Fis domain